MNGVHTMALEYQVDSLDGLDDSVKGLYKENDGKFSLDIDLGGSFIPAAEVTGLKNHRDKLLTEKKEQQKLANDAASESKRIKEEAALKSGDIESLRKSWKEKEEAYLNEISTFTVKESNNAKSKAATNIAMGLAEGANVKLLSKFIIERLKFESGEVRVTDKNGNLTVSSLDDLSKEFANNADFKALLVGSKASGSGAAKGTIGGAGKIEMPRAEFDSMNPAAKHKFITSGGKPV
jgi:hypothetical protein